MRVIEPRGKLDFAEESVWSDGVAQLWMQNLDRHSSIVAEIVAEVDGCHAAATELPVDAVRLCDRVFEIHRLSLDLDGFFREQLDEFRLMSENVEIRVVLDPVPVAESVVDGLFEGRDSFLFLAFECKRARDVVKH